MLVFSFVFLPIFFASSHSDLTHLDPIDHNDASVGTYQNQYFVNEEYYSPGGPTLLFDVGESLASTRAELLLYNSSSYFTEFLKEFHAMGIVWEHRYLSLGRQDHHLLPPLRIY